MQIRKQLRLLNAFDMELYEYAKKLVQLRINHTNNTMSLFRSMMQPANISTYLRICGDLKIRNRLLPYQKVSIGTFQPPGHKGPSGTT